jgi:hypothetical protein
MLALALALRNTLATPLHLDSPRRLAPHPQRWENGSKAIPRHGDAGTEGSFQMTFFWEEK